MKTIQDSWFWSKVVISRGCWLWSGSKDEDGYGKLKRKGKTLRAHRVAYELMCGVIPVGALVCHHCDNPLCVRPSHLWLGTPLANMLDKCAKGRHKGRHKLTQQQVEEIRERYAEGGLSHRALAEEYGVGPGAVQALLSRRNWK